MSTDTALIEKREELKRRLAAGEYKTLVDVILAATDRLIRKITRRSKPVPIWFITVIMSIVLILISLAAIYVSGDWTNFRKVIEWLGLGYRAGFVWMILISGLSTVSILITNHSLSRIVDLWRDKMLDATESLISLNDFQDWLETVGNKRLHLLMMTSLGLCFVYLISIPIMNQLGILFGYGYIFASIIVTMVGSGTPYSVFVVGLLSARLRRYDLKLFAANPSSSELISHLSTEFSFIVYIVAGYMAVWTLALAMIGQLPSYGILLAFSWLPPIALFVLNQTSLSSIIRRVKWKSLNEVQAKIEKLRASKNFGTPKNALLWKM